jgi:hypothetical protein
MFVIRLSVGHPQASLRVVLHPGVATANGVLGGLQGYT